MRDWLAAISMLAGLTGALGSLFAFMSNVEANAVLLILHLTSYALILSGFDYLARTRHVR